MKSLTACENWQPTAACGQIPSERRLLSGVVCGTADAAAAAAAADEEPPTEAPAAEAGTAAAAPEAANAEEADWGSTCAPAEEPAAGRGPISEPAAEGAAAATPCGDV